MTVLFVSISRCDRFLLLPQENLVILARPESGQEGSRQASKVPVTGFTTKEPSKRTKSFNTDGRGKIGLRV